MINYLTRLFVADNTGIRVVQCIKLLGKTKSNVSNIGGIIIMVTKRLFAWSQFKKGLVLRGLIVRSCLEFMRGNGIWVKFAQNAVVVLNKKKAPAAKRLKGPFLKEVCIRYNLLGTVSRFLV